MSKRITNWKEWEESFHAKRDELRAFLHGQRTKDLQEAFPQYAKEKRARLIIMVLCDLTREFYEQIETASEAEVQKREREIERQIHQFESL